MIEPEGGFEEPAFELAAAAAVEGEVEGDLFGGGPCGAFGEAGEGGEPEFAAGVAEVCGVLHEEVEGDEGAGGSGDDAEVTRGEGERAAGGVGEDGVGGR